MKSIDFKHIGRQIGAKLLVAILSIVLACSSISAFAITKISDWDKMGADGGSYFSTFTSNDELGEVTKATNIEVATEGAILLKNGGGVSGTEDKLPYGNMKNISLFGIYSDAYGYGGTGSGSGQLAEGADIYSSFVNAGININPRLKALYQAHSGGSQSMVATYTTPTYEDKELPMSYYTEAIQATYPRYSDAAFIVISRLGGEGTDLAVENVDGHVRPNSEGVLVDFDDEHYLELTYREEQLIEHVTDNFDKVVILFNSGNIIEFGELENNPKIDAILHVGQTGDYGFDGIIKVLKGEVSPSGRTVDIYPADFTLDPVYQNFGNGSQTVAEGTNYNYQWKESATATAVAAGNMVEYEEGIYLGYKYYETMYEEIKAGNVDLTAAATKAVLNSEDIPDEYTDADDWYAKNIVYPFGYGLSYTSFAWSNLTITPSETPITKNTTFTATVDVENVGTVPGKDVVEIYMSAPYTPGGIEKSAVTLVGFGKSKLLSIGGTDTVTITFDAYDIASYDYSDANGNSFAGYEIDAGNHVFTARRNSHEAILANTLNLNDLKLNQAQATGATIKNAFIDSPEEDAVYNFTSISPTMTIMSRGNIISTFPKAPTEQELMLRPSGGINPLATGKDYQITAQDIRDKMTYGFIFGRDDEEKEIWNTAEAVVPSSWTQAINTSATVNVRLPEMMGIDPYDTTTRVRSSNAAIDGKTHAAAWEVFMNQLTYEELKLLNTTGFFKTAPIDRIGKEEAVDADGPCTIGGQTTNGYISDARRGSSGTRYWCAAQMVAATWNVELAKRVGVLIGEEGMWNGYNGWYAPSMNTHRSPFSGRNFEYYSQDGVHGGLIAGAVISGVSSRGIYPYIKHFALNDQETSRGGICTWSDEQAIRENILRPFQYAVEQGGASAVMTGFNRIGAVACSENYPLLTQILRGEWGFQGTIVTDYQVGTVGDTTNNLEIMARSGNNIPLADRNEDARGCGIWDATLRNGKGGVKVGVVTMVQTQDQSGNLVWTPSYSTETFVKDERTNEIQYYYTRTRAMEVLYTHVRSNAIDNGADFQKNFAAQTIVLPANSAGTKVIKTGFDKDADVVYSLVSSNLPAGVSFDIKTLTLSSNTNAAVGSGSLKIKVSYDGWANKTVEFAVQVVTPVKYDGATALAKNTAYEATVSQEFWAATPNLGATQVGTVSVTPSAEGLPAGLSFDAGTQKITGTPTTAGEYNVAVTYTVVTRTVNASGQVTNSTARYSSTFKLTVGTLVTATINGVAQKIESGSKLTAPAAPAAPEGKRFVGWFVGDTAFDFNTAISADIALTAKFEAIPDSIEFRVHGGKVQASINGGAWTDVIELDDITGPAGADGATGATGPAGAAGAKGDPGEAAEGCNSSLTLNSSIIAFVFVLITGIALIAISRKKKED